MSGECVLYAYAKLTAIKLDLNHKAIYRKCLN